ncbi:UNVERIFIED_CONTAM: hypothetical protein Sradi_5733500 [Sesamum radiatum]|uniref:Transposase n=1 Tax=Sesamum radiatum TaxID=300843 RepID=A0AAW2L4M2_SESRA
MKGFMEGYYNWTAHGEAQVIEYYDDPPTPVFVEIPVAPNVSTHWGDVEQMNWDQRMVYDAAGPHFFSAHPTLNLWVPVVLFLLMPINRYTMVVMNPNCRRLPDWLTSRPRIICLRDAMIRMTSDWSTASSVVTRGTNLPRIGTPNARSPHTLSLEEGSMCHPSDAEAWRHFDKSYPDFAVEPRNVRLALCTDGFAPHGQQFLPHDHPYRRNKRPFTKNWQERKIARPKLTGDEIRHRVEQYGTAVEEPLTYPPGYGNVHKWTKKSIFWDLPYWNTHLIRYNLDVMHIEKNVFDNIFNTVMDIKGKTKDNLNTRKDLKNICNRPELEVDERRPNAMPKAAYTLTKEQKKKICEWVRSLRFPDGYASNIARCVDIANLRVHGMKSHDYHVFMQKLIPVAFRELLPEFVWSALTEKIGWFTSHYFESHIICKRHRPSRNDELTQNNDRVARDIFNHPGRTSGVSMKRYAFGQERHVMETYVLCNSEVVAPYYRSFLNELYETYSPDDPIIDQSVATDFKAWFKRCVEPELQNIEDDLLKSLY